MIKAVITIEGRHTLLLGLSGENMARLMADEPIPITRDMLVEMGLPSEMDILLIGGKDETDLVDQLRAQGFTGIQL